MSIAAKCTCGKSSYCVGGEGCYNLPMFPMYLTPTVMYIVIAYRWGNREKHSYIVGIFTNDKDAVNAAELETNFRGGKYACFVEKSNTNEYNQDKENYTEVIYNTLIPYNQ